MLEFMNSNGVAIQAISAIVSVLATLALVLITAKYVSLTQQLAQTAQAGLEQQREAARARRRHLLAVLKMLRVLLANLPADRQRGELMRRAAMWDNNDLSELQELSAEFGMKEGQLAGLAAASMRFLRDRVEEVRAVNPNRGFDWSRFPWDQWDRELRLAGEQLGELFTTVASAS